VDSGKINRSGRVSRGTIARELLRVSRPAGEERRLNGILDNSPKICKKSAGYACSIQGFRRNLKKHDWKIEADLCGKNGPKCSAGSGPQSRKGTGCEKGGPEVRKTRRKLRDPAQYQKDARIEGKTDSREGAE